MNNSIINTAQINRARINITGLNCVGIPSSSRSDKPTLDPALKAKLVGVWDCHGKTNEDADRGIIRDRTGKGNHLEILNAAYKLNSGYGLWKENFNDGIWSKLLGVNKTGTRITLNSEKDWSKGGWITYKTSGNVIASFKVKISGMPVGGDLRFSSVKMVDGINVIPSYTATAAIGFSINSIGQDWSKLVIEQIPDYQGAFVTDGADDMIVSNKTATDMLQGATKFTVISVIRNLTSDAVRYNFISRDGAWSDGRILLGTSGNISISGYSYDNDTPSVINTILGDKANYYAKNGLSSSLLDELSIVGYRNIVGRPSSIVKIAYYGGFMAKDVLTTDEINQIVAYYNLDWWIEPDGWYDVAKQGITNENHSTFNDKLIDFSPNKRDLVCNNFSWGGNSGVGKWDTDFNMWNKSNDTTSTKSTMTFIKVIDTVTSSISAARQPSLKMKFKVTGLEKAISDKLSAYIRIYDSVNTNKSIFITKDGIHDIDYIPNEGAVNIFIYLSPIGHVPGVARPLNEPVIIEQIPMSNGGLWHDGVDDSCHYIGDLGLKDYTVIWDREYGTQNSNIVSLSSDPTAISVSTPFVLDSVMLALGIVEVFSFGIATSVGTMEQHKIRKIYYQSTYVSDFKPIAKGNSISTGKGIVFGRYGSGNPYVVLGFYGLLLYPYSMNAFLIERQLKKRKFGTLYPKNE